MKVDSPPRPLRLNVGCGLFVHPAWENIDDSVNARLAKVPGLRPLLHRAGLLPAASAAVPWPSGVRCLDASKRLPYADGSVDSVFSSHFLEHLPRHKARAFLAEAFRVLKVGGIIRTIVPDLETYAREYLSGVHCDSASEEPAADRFMRETCLAFDLHTRSSSSRFAWLHEAITRNAHRYMYDRRSLLALLKEAEFTDLRVMEYGFSKIPGITEIERQERFDRSICIEGIR